MKTSEALFARALEVMPGGVNSPVRAFRSVGGNPRFICSAKGSHITDVEGNTYLDYIGSWGPMILGHADDRVLKAVTNAAEFGLSFGASTEAEVLLAELITKHVPHVEMIRMVSSGTEAVMSALRLARGFTGREKIIKFAGCYHGHSDSMLVKAGSGALTFGAPDSAGVTKGAAADTLLAEYNHLDSVEQLFQENADTVACVVVEPVAANMGVVLPEPDFLKGLRALCDQYGALLIFDEVITGFRLAFGGAAAYYQVIPDLVTYGKIIGGGMPVGAYGGRKDVMSHVSPSGTVYQAGTLSGNPIAMAAGLQTLQTLLDHPEIYTQINALGKQLADGLRQTGYTVNQVGSLCGLFCTKSPVTDFQTATQSDTAQYARYFNRMLQAGIYIAPAQFEAMFVSAAHTETEIAKTIQIAQEILEEL